MSLQEQVMTAPVQHPMYIDGQFVTWQGDAWIDVTNPATEALLSRIPDGTAEDARKAIDAADKAQPAWEALPAIERAGGYAKLPPVFVPERVKSAR
jgi:lactaldehyde dehydrogenase/glycolaldehyde dehydrogenase